MIVQRDSDGRITLTWAQAVWGIATIATVIACYYNLQLKIDKIGMIVASNTLRIEAIESRNRNIGFNQSDAQELQDELQREIADLRRRIIAKEKR